MSLRVGALCVAAAHVDFGIREVGGNNLGPIIRRYAANAEPPMKEGIAWCALFVQFCSDLAARTLGIKNPLDRVKLEALVQSYYEEFRLDVIGPNVHPEPGDLVLFKFPRGGKPSETWNHIGFLAQPAKPASTIVVTIEGNTGDVDQRDGDGVYRKPRDTSRYPTCFIRWAA